MIVDPDFMDHWRTGMVADSIGDAMAPVYILRLWAHCQERKADTFAMPTRGLKAQCKFPGDAAAFEQALVEAGFVERDGDSLKVLGWAEKNASLIAAWDNGSKGGRPKKNTDETPGKPTGNPDQTEGKPGANPGETDKSREEKNSTSLRSVEAAPKRASRKCPAQFEVTEELREWAATKAPGIDLDTETCKLRDHTFKSAITDWAGAWRNWMRRASESLPRSRAGPASRETEFQRSQRERAERFTGGLVSAKAPGHQPEVFDATP